LEGQLSTNLRIGRGASKHLTSSWRRLENHSRIFPVVRVLGVG
jgi:hypothetical protein